MEDWPDPVKICGGCFAYKQGVFLLKVGAGRFYAYIAAQPVAYGADNALAYRSANF